MEESRFRDDIVQLENILDGRSPPAQLSLSFLNYITDDFSYTREIGRGGYGIVYRGKFKNTKIALKKLTFSKKAEKDFTREIDSLMNVNHNNIVRFLGYCNETKSEFVNAEKLGERRSFVYTQDRVICFEYISNGSLTGHIHDELRGHDWQTRYKIIKDICEGLHYLHKQRMVHRDLKPDNILLDNLMVPKIADLGICKLLEDGATQAVTTNASASWQYAAPEFSGGGRVSLEYDIYSLGIIIIQLVTGFRKDPDVKNVLTRWRHRWNESNETLKYQQVLKCIEIGLSCQNKKYKKRPTILKIIEDLHDVDAGNGVFGQEIPCWNNLLRVEPPELFFPFQVQKEMSCSPVLYNETDAYMAFFVKADSELEYKIDPEKGVVQPFSTFTVNITLLEQEEAPENMRHVDVFTVKSKRVNEGIMAEDITKDIFSKKSGDIVDKVRIGVVFDAKLIASATCAACMINEETKEHRGSQWTGETSSDDESSSHSPGGRDKASDFQGKQVKKKYTSSEKSNDMTSASGGPKQVTLSFLEAITDFFSPEKLIGAGTFGKVYKATLENGDLLAVKMLHNISPGTDDEMFQREYKNLMRVEHENIARLVGYCYETKHQPMQYMGRTVFAESAFRALCFDYMQNGSLQNHLSDECDGLEWIICYKIIKGTCQGLKYLHEGLSEPIYHLDIKPENILLDKDMVPKLTDFGSSRHFSDQQTMMTRTALGTMGYIPMEYIDGNIISNKFDIFSLGVVMIKIIAGLGGYSKSVEIPRQEFIDLVQENWRNRMLETCQVSRQLEAYVEQVNICTEIALNCLEMDRHKRPSIGEIVHRLNDTEVVVAKAIS